MTEPPRRYDVTITVDRDGGHLPNPAEFAVAAEQAASATAASIGLRYLQAWQTKTSPSPRPL